MQPLMLPLHVVQGLNPPSLTKPQAYLSWRGTVLQAGRSGDWEAARAELAAAQVEQAAAVEAAQEMEVPQQQEPEGPSRAPSAGPQEASAPAGTSAGSRGAQRQPPLNMLPPVGISRQALSKGSALPADAARPEEAAATGGRTPVTAVASPLPSPTSPVPSPPDALQQGQLAGVGAGACSEPGGVAQHTDANYAAAPEASPGPRRHLNLGSPRRSEELQHDRRSQTVDYAVRQPACTWQALLLGAETVYKRLSQVSKCGCQRCAASAGPNGQAVAQHQLECKSYQMRHSWLQALPARQLQAWALNRTCSAQIACRLHADCTGGKVAARRGSSAVSHM